MSEPLAYTRKQFVIAVNLSAVLGWSIFAIPVLLGGGLDLILWVAAIGLPIAFIICWLIVSPILKRVMQKNVTWAGAVGWGTIITLVLAFISIAIFRYWGWQISRDPYRSNQLGGGDNIREVDGILTTYGWLMLGQRTVIFVLGGVAIALVIRWIIGPATSAQHDR